jgi:hypothetical protein
MKKTDNSVKITGGRELSIAGHVTQLFRDMNKQYVITYMMVYKAMNHVMLPNMH